MKFNVLLLITILASSCISTKNSTNENLSSESFKFDKELIPIPSLSKRERGNYKISEAKLYDDFIFITVEPLDIFNAYVFDILELPVSSNSTTIKKRLLLIQIEDMSKLDDSKPIRDSKNTSSAVKFILKVDISSITSVLKSGERIEFSIDEFDGRVLYTKK